MRNLNKKDDVIYFEFIKEFNLKVLSTGICEDFSFLIFLQTNESKKDLIIRISKFWDISDFELLTVISNYYILIFEF